MADENADSGEIERRRILRNAAVGAVGLTGLVGTGAAEALDAGSNGGGSGPNKKACYWESECRYGDEGYGHYTRECCPDPLIGEQCTEWELMDDQLCLSP